MAKIILTQADVEVYRDISNNFNESRFNAFALEIQQTQLRELLGDKLYTALYNDLDDTTFQPASAIFEELIDGKDYLHNGDTITYFGLIPFMVYHWLGINLREGDLFQSEVGNISFDMNQQDNMQRTSQAKADRVNASYMKNVVSYRNNIVKFLNDNYTTYPEWVGRNENEPKTSFNIMTV